MGRKRKHQWAGIIKLQWPLSASSGQEPQVLIYDETRTVNVMFPASDVFKKKLGDDVKGYFEAVLRWDGHLEIGERAEDQPW